MTSGVGGSRVPIPSNVRKTIQDIREITGKQHSDHEIYAVLKECYMDPNETAQKLLYLDTFHEVKSRRDRRKENLNGRGPDKSRLGTGIQRRAVRGGDQDVAGGRNSGRRENGASNIDSMSSLRVPPKTKSGATSRITKPTVIPNGFTNLPYGSSSHGYDLKSSSDSDGCLADVNKLGAEASQSDGTATSHTFGTLGNKQGKSASKIDQLPTSASPASVYSLADSGVAPSSSGRSACVSLTNSEEGNQQRAKPNHTGSMTNLSSHDTGLSYNVKPTPVAPNNIHIRKSSSKLKSKLKTHECKQLLENSQSPPSLTYDGDSVGRLSSNVDGQSPQESLVQSKEVVGVAVEAISESLLQSNVFDGQHVTFPNHFQVPEALKNVLTFGSFDTTCGLELDSVNVGGDNNCASQSSRDGGESVKELSSDKNTSSISGVYPDHTQCSPLAIEVSFSPEVNVPAGTDSEAEPPKQEIQLHQEVSQNPPVMNGPNYSIGLMSSTVGNQLASFNGHEPQIHETHVPSLYNENSLALAAANPASPAPSSITISPQSVPFHRQTYSPPNLFPYGQYISPVYTPPMHQFLYLNGFPAQPSTGNMFLSPAAAAAAGIKFSLSQFKPGTNDGNLAHIGLQSGSSFITAPVGYAPASSVPSGSSMGSDDIVASQLKESQIYSTGQRTEGLAVWIHAPGQDISSLPVNPLFNLSHQGHQVAFLPAQAGHGAFSGLYPPGHPITAPANLLQQSQLMTGAVETIGPPSGAYQQAQYAQVNWNTAF